jgi:hypothetical protein
MLGEATILQPTVWSAVDTYLHILLHRLYSSHMHSVHTAMTTTPPAAMHIATQHRLLHSLNGTLPPAVQATVYDSTWQKTQKETQRKKRQAGLRCWHATAAHLCYSVWYVWPPYMPLGKNTALIPTRFLCQLHSVMQSTGYLIHPRWILSQVHITNGRELSVCCSAPPDGTPTSTTRALM